MEDKRVRPAAFVGKKGLSGRKSKFEEMEKFKEQITQEALIKLANRIVYKRLEAVELEDGSKNAHIKELALPILLKGMTTKVDHTTLGEKITNTEKIEELTNILNDLYKGTSESSNGKSSSTLGDKAQDKE